MMIYSPANRNERRLFALILLLSGAVLLLLLIFYIANPRPVVGDALVNSAGGRPEEFPPPGTSPFYVKPVTIMFVSSVTFAYCLFGLLARKIRQMPRSILQLLLMASLVAFGVSLYETLFNFTLWASQMTSHSDPDLLTNSFPTGSVRTNLVFATKSFVTMLFVSLFGVESFSSSLAAPRVRDKVVGE
jgi:hypothetical protein